MVIKVVGENDGSERYVKVSNLSNFVWRINLRLRNVSIACADVVERDGKKYVVLLDEQDNVVIETPGVEYMLMIENNKGEKCSVGVSTGRVYFTERVVELIVEENMPTVVVSVYV